MKLLVLDNFKSFSLVPYIKASLEDHEVWEMATVVGDQMWCILRDLAPDVIFVDFCNENAVVLTERVKDLPKKPKIVIWLHGYEAQSWYMGKIVWGEVSDLIVVSPKFKEIVESKLVGKGVNVHVVPNGIDLDRFKLQSEFDDNSIAYAGYINKKKGPTLLRTVMASMPEKQFHVAGVHQDEQVRLYFEAHPLRNVEYYGWVETEDFLRGKRFILSTSVTESFGMSIAEGMAMGLTPLVHGWPGAQDLWPTDCIWTTFDELKAIEPQDPEKCRAWVADRYSMGSCINRVTNLLFANKRAFEAASAGTL